VVGGGGGGGMSSADPLPLPSPKTKSATCCFTGCRGRGERRDVLAVG
jgi:hypothetical protein